jgi:hypothetical protein
MPDYRCTVPAVLVALLCAACVVILSVKLHKQHVAYRLLNEGMEQLRNVHANLATQETCRLEELSLNGSFVDMQLKVSTDNGQKSTLGEVITENVLVCYFSELYCDLCMDVELNNLKKLTDAIGGKHVIILLHTTNERYFRKFMVEKKAACPVYKTGKCPALLVEMNHPCYFILEKASGRMASVFIPQKENIAVTEIYLEQVRKKYFTAIK